MLYNGSVNALQSYTQGRSKNEKTHHHRRNRGRSDFARHLGTCESFEYEALNRANNRPTRIDTIFGDLQAFVDSGNALLNGQYISQYPLPAVIIFALFALLPAPALLAFVLGSSVVLLVSMFKRRALAWIFFAPVLQTLALGQLTIFWLWLLRRASPLSLALLTLKPQLAILALPLLARRRELWRPFALWMAVIYVPTTLLRPSWPIEWIQQINDGRLNGTSSSLWTVPVLALGFALFVVWTYRKTLRRVKPVRIALGAVGRSAWPSLATVLNPAIRAYDYAMLTGLSLYPEKRGMLWLIPLSWIAVAAMWLTESAWPMAIVGVGALVLNRTKDRDG